MCLCTALQELDLSRCQLNDAGGAAVCLALQQQDTLQELSLSWNALSHATACALEGLFRYGIWNFIALVLLLLPLATVTTEWLMASTNNTRQMTPNATAACVFMCVRQYM